MHIRTTVETDAIAASSVNKCLIFGSPVHDGKLSGFAVSDVLSPCCSVFGSLNSDISFFYPWNTESGGLGPNSPDSGSLLGLCNPMYAFGSAVVASLGPGPPVPGSLLSLHNHVYALKSVIIGGLGPGPPVSRSPDLLNPVYAFGSAVIASLGPSPADPGFLLGLCSPIYALKSAVLAGLGPSVPRCLDLLNPVYAIWSATIAGLGPGPPAHEFLPFLDFILSPKYTGSPTALADLSPVLCSYALKRFVFDTSVTSYFSAVLVSLCDNGCVLFTNKSYCCAQEFLFMNYVTSTYNLCYYMSLKFCHYCCLCIINIFYQYHCRS